MIIDIIDFWFECDRHVSPSDCFLHHCRYFSICNSFIPFSELITMLYSDGEN